MVLVPFKTSAVRKQSYDPLRSFRDEFDRLFDDFLPTLTQGSASPASSMMDVRIDLSETDKHISIRAELPGVEEKDIDLQLARDVLTLRGEKRFENEEKNHNYHVVESSYGSFARSIRLPFEAASDAVSAKFKNGVLSITVAKPEKPKQESLKIEVKAE